ncbi:DUF5131 family protein [Roseibium sp.]|uniref:DUF5131 family protein n=1 Tax=Roseibium sp. TaxID=1936156 RepID=UPI003B52A886
MADHSKIEWTDATWNPITGCTLVSKGCENCYAAEMAASRLKNHPSRQGLARRNAAGIAKFTGAVRFNTEWLTQPLAWKTPRKVFVCAHGDLFHESVRQDWIDQVFAVMALSPRHIFQVLTKRPDRMREYFADQPRARRRWEDIIRETYGRTTKSPPPTLPNVWLGVSVEDQETANERIPALLETSAAVRFLSAEPLLGPLDLNSTYGGTLWIGGQRGCGGTHRHDGCAGQTIHDVLHYEDPKLPHHHHDERCRRGLDWVIVGGESGKNARPMHPEWARQIRDQCQQAGVPFLFKQWGAWHAISQMADGAADRLYKSNRIARGGQSQMALDDIYGLTCTVPQLVLQNDGDHVDVCHPNAFKQEFQSVQGFRVGKKAAGRLLDGVQHDGFPEQGAEVAA